MTHSASPMHAPIASEVKPIMRNVPPPPRPAPVTLPSLQTHHSAPPPRPTEPPARPIQQPSHVQTNLAHDSQYMGGSGGGGLFSSLRGGAGSFLKNLKDTSSKVMQTVQQTMARTDLDISAITSRILVMPCPSEGLESTYKTNNIEDIKIYMESRYAPAKMSVYNLGPRTCARIQPPVRTIEGSFMYPLSMHAPQLQGMYSMVEDMFGFLSADPKSTLIVQSADSGRSTSATMVCALFIYAGLVTEPEDAMQIFAVKRMPPNLRPSELRYLYYLGDIVRPTPHLPHFKPITLASVTCSPVPRMTRARDGCRMFVEVSCNDKVVVTTIQEYDRMRLVNHFLFFNSSFSINTILSPICLV